MSRVTSGEASGELSRRGADGAFRGPGIGLGMTGRMVRGIQYDGAKGMVSDRG